MVRQPAAEPRLDRPPPARIVGVTVRHGPERVQVVGENNHRVDHERTLLPHAAEDLPQEISVVREKLGARSRNVTVKKYVPPGTRTRRDSSPCPRLPRIALRFMQATPLRWLTAKAAGTGAVTAAE